MKRQIHPQKPDKSVPVSFSRTNSYRQTAETHFIDQFSDSAIHLQRLHAASWLPYFTATGINQPIVKGQKVLVERKYVEVAK